jgi:hypothetical protein
MKLCLFILKSMKQIKECCLACISKSSEQVEETDNNTVTAPVNIVCCKSLLVQKHGADEGSEKSFGESVLQPSSSSQFFECTEFAETIAIQETSD